MPTLNACDFAYPPSSVSIEQFYRALYAAGIRAVQRYLWRGGKGVTSREIAAAKNAGPNGIKIAYGYEGYASNWRGGAAQGVRDSAEAVAIAADLGIPDGEPIYYAVDEDAAGMGRLDTALAYIHGANRPNHPARAYGGYDVIEALKLPGFQTYAWSGGRVSRSCALYQWHNGQWLAGGEVDYGEIRDADALGIGAHHPQPQPLTLVEEIMALNPDDPDYKRLLADFRRELHDEFVDAIGMLGGKGAAGHKSGDYDPEHFDIAGVLERIDPQHKEHPHPHHAEHAKGH